ncbi:transcription factor [Ganoderma sinense ZZ0214-1]|uniref:Transcription factor n=1 Tax=Ganoderma sinense ZZ0214-1 TaxID=1077348 RepID=A0A2G8SNY3_9APHY|nr:transcription factor [Ganoderma sinense ZZ0214-1]
MELAPSVDNALEQAERPTASIQMDQAPVRRKCWRSKLLGSRPAFLQTPEGSPSRALLSRLAIPEPMPFAVPSAVEQPLSPDPLVEPPQDLVRTLVNAFVPHSSSLGFFLHMPRFIQAMQLPGGDPRRAQLSPALLNAVYLWGAHLSTSNTIRGYEPAFLARATAALSSALRDSHYNVMHLIQAEVLVANYFFSMSRFLEGRYHCSAAVALALSCRLTKVRSAADGPPHRGHALGGHAEPRRNQHLPPPRDAIEEGERIRGFWSVYALDKSWAVALGSPSHFNGVAQSGTHIDTPWPLEMAQFEAGGMPADFRSSLTVLNFLSGATAMPASSHDSQLSLRAKAATLFERATHLASQWSTVTDRNDFYARYVVLDGLIDRFTAALSPLDRSRDADAAMTVLVTHTLARAATIQLRSSFKDYDRLKDRKDLAAAQAAAALLENFNVPPVSVDPILAILWTAVCRVFIGQATTVARGQAGAGPSSSPTGQRDAARGLLDRVLAVMNRFRETSPLMGMLHDGFVSVQGAM